MATGAAAEEKQRDLPLHPEEIRLAKRDLLDYILQELIKVENYWRFRYREIVGLGIGISFETSTDIGETDDGLALAWILKIYIPEELWIKLAKLRKMRRFKLPKPHPIVRQRYREMAERVAEMEEELSRSIEEYEVEGERAEGDQAGGAGRGAQAAARGLRGVQDDRAGPDAQGDSEGAGGAGGRQEGEG